MNSLQPLKLSELDFNNVHYDKVKSNDTKTIIYLKYSNSTHNNLVFQVPTLLNNNKPKKNNDVYELDIPLVSKSKDRIEHLVKKLDELEKKLYLIQKFIQKNGSVNLNLK